MDGGISWSPRPGRWRDVLSADAVAQLAKDAGFTGQDLVTAFGSKEELYKAKENAEAARQLFVWAGKTFDPWVAFKNGSYKTHRQAAQQAVNAIAAKPAPKPAPKP